MATTDRVTRLEQAVQRWRTWQQSHDKWHEEFAKEMEEEFERSAKRRQAMIQKMREQQTEINEVMDALIGHMDTPY